MHKSSDENVYSLKGTGYLAMKEKVIRNHADIQFSIRLPALKKNEKVVLIYFESIIHDCIIYNLIHNLLL